MVYGIAMTTSKRAIVTQCTPHPSVRLVHLDVSSSHPHLLRRPPGGNECIAALYLPSKWHCHQRIQMSLWSI